MALTYAGLVFAGLAIGLDATDRGSPSNSAPLVVALISAVLAWAVSNLGSRRWVAFVADALLLLSVGELLIGVLALFSPSPDAFVTGVVAIAGSRWSGCHSQQLTQPGWLTGRPPASTTARPTFKKLRPTWNAVQTIEKQFDIIRCR